MKEQIIQLPDNFEVKEIKDGKIILVEKKKKLTYGDIAKELFANKRAFYITVYGITKSSICESFVEDSNNCTSRKQAEKLLAINKLMNVAKYLNDGWQPDWNNEKEDKYFIAYNYAINEIQTDADLVFQNSYIYFKSEELAQQAVNILGEEIIRLALCTDY